MEKKTIKQKLEERLQIAGTPSEIDRSDLGLTLVVPAYTQAIQTMRGNTPIDSFVLSPVSYFHDLKDIEEVVRDHYVGEGYSFLRNDALHDETVFEKDGRIYSADYNINPEARVMNFTFGPDKRNPLEYKKEHGLG